MSFGRAGCCEQSVGGDQPATRRNRTTASTRRWAASSSGARSSFAKIRWVCFSTAPRVTLSASAIEPFDRPCGREGDGAGDEREQAPQHVEPGLDVTQRREERTQPAVPRLRTEVRRERRRNAQHRAQPQSLDVREPAGDVRRPHQDAEPDAGHDDRAQASCHPGDHEGDGRHCDHERRQGVAAVEQHPAHDGLLGSGYHGHQHRLGHVLEARNRPRRRTSSQPDNSKARPRRADITLR
jgi:hypothetical protein